VTGPISIGENRREAAASAADGTRPAEAEYRIRCGGRHIVLRFRLLRYTTAAAAAGLKLARLPIGGGGDS
jgi:hypothetical protein